MIKGFTINNGYAVPSQEIIDYKKKQIFKNIGIPTEYWDLTIENFTINQDSLGNELSSSEKIQKKKAYEITLQYSKNIEDIMNGNNLEYNSNLNDRIISSQNIIFQGDNSSGKTLLSSIILKSAIEKNTNILFIPWIYFYSILSDFDSKNIVNELEEKLISSKLIIIDGITNYAYNNNNFFLKKMEYITNKRNYEKLPNIWTSYVSGQKLCEMFGPITQSFIKNAIIVKLPSGSTRDIFKEI